MVTKKIGALTVSANVSPLLNKVETKPAQQETTIEYALQIVNRQMQINGIRERTMKDYNLTFYQFVNFNRITHLEQITAQSIYDWLDSMNVAKVTKKNRLKYVKAMLTKCHDNGWFEHKFWNTIQIRIDRTVKEGAKEHDLNILLSLLDTSTFVGLRDAVAILTIYRTGVRINTLGQITEDLIDFEKKEFCLPGEIMKNRNILKLPLDDELLELYRILIEQNAQVREHYNKKNEYLFITKEGNCVVKGNSNSITKRLYKYSKMYELKNINAHAIRRAYAMGLLKKGAPIPLISKALGHSSLDVTTQYLHLELEEVVKDLREFL